MPQDFSRQNLRGRSFKGQNLNGADFSGADLRGADFTHALLIGANFRGTKAGLQQRWVVGLVVCSWLAVGLSGFFSILVGTLATYIVAYPTNIQDFITGIIYLITLAFFFIVIFRKGLVAGAVAIAFAIALTGALTGAAIAFAIAFTVAGVVALAGAFAFTLASAYIGWCGWAGDVRGVVKGIEPRGLRGIGLFLGDIYLLNEPITMRAKVSGGVFNSLTTEITCVSHNRPEIAASFTAENGTWVMTTDALETGLYRIKVQTDNTDEDAPNPVHNLFEVVDLGE